MSNITLTHSESERLELLIEEASEVIKAAAKILRHGYGSYDPTKPAVMRRSNREDLEEELGDLCAALMRLSDAKEVSLTAIMDRRDYKLARGGKYLRYQAFEDAMRDAKEAGEEIHVKSEDYEGPIELAGVKTTEQARREAEEANPMINLEVSLSPELQERLEKGDPEALDSIRTLQNLRNRANERTLQLDHSCKLPPLGWSCSRAAGHSGPCAATRDEDN